MAGIDLKTETPDTSINDSAVLFGADSQASASPSVYAVSTLRNHIIGTANTFTATQTINPAVNTAALASTGYSLTGSASASFVDLAGTWNTSGTPTAIKLNITNTASTNGLLMDLQTGGTSRFRVTTGGGVNASTYLNGNYGLQPNTGALSYLDVAGAIIFRNADAAYAELGRITSSGFNVGSGQDLFLRRRGAANLALGAADAAAPVAQTLSVQSVVAGTSNTPGAEFRIDGSQGTGTGAGGSLVFRVAPAGSSGTAQNALADALTISSTGVLSVGFSSGQNDPLNNGRWIVKHAAGNFGLSYSAGGSGGTTLFNGSVTASLIGSTSTWAAVRFGLSTSPTAQASDVILERDAANTLGQRNGVNAQRFNIYNTWTSATNYEAFKIDWITTANTVLVGTEKGSGGGTARALAFQTDGVTALTINTDRSLTLTGAGTASIANATVAGANNSLILTGSSYVAAESPNFSLLATGVRTFWIERSTAQHMVSGFILGWSSSATNAAIADDTILAREAAGVTAVRGANTTTGGALGFIEQTAPAAPATNGVRIYAEDNGSGKTRLMALFATGAAQQIAIEP